MRPLVLKFGGELLEDRASLATVVSAVAAVVERGGLVAIVHGGGKEIDAALKRAGIETRQVDGLRITDPATLDIVVAVVAGTDNTALVDAGTASAGMIAKLRACEHALAGGVDDVVIVDGRNESALVGATESTTPSRATRISHARRMEREALAER